MTAPTSSTTSTQSNAAAIAAQRAAEARRRAEEAQRRAQAAAAAAEKAKAAQEKAAEARNAVQATQGQLEQPGLKAPERTELKARLETQKSDWREARFDALVETRRAGKLLAKAETSQVQGQSAATRANVDGSTFDTLKEQNQATYDRLLHGPKLPGMQRIEASVKKQAQLADARQALADFRELRATAADPSSWTPDQAKDFTASLKAVVDAQGISPATQNRLLEQSAPQLEAAAPVLSEMIRKGGDDLSTEERQAMYDSIAGATELMKPEQQAAFAGTFSASMGNVDDLGGDDDELGGIVRQSIENGAGASLSAQVLTSLQEDDKGLAANSLAGYVTDGVEALREDFRTARREVDRVSADAARLIKPWGVKGEPNADVLEQFREDEGFDQKQAAFQEAGAQLSTTLDGLGLLPGSQPCPTSEAEAAANPTENLDALASNADEVLKKDIEHLARTRAGSEAIANAVVSVGRGEPSWLDVVNVAGQSNDQVRKIQGAVTSAVSAHAFELAQAGQLDAARSSLTKGLGRLGHLYQASDDDMARIASQLDSFRPDMGDDALRSWAKGYSQTVDEVVGKSVASQSLKAFGVALGAASLPGAWSSFSDASLQQKMATLSTTLGVANDGAALVLDGFATFAASKSASAASAALEKFGGPVTAALGAGVEGFQAFNEFSEGDVTGGISHSLLAAGNLALVASPFLGGAGTAVALGAAAVLTVAGVVVGLFDSPENPWGEDEEQVKLALEGWGVSPELADELKEINDDGQTFGPFVQQAAKAAGVSSLELLHAMDTWSDDQVAQFLDVARLSHDDHDGNEARYDNAAAIVGEDLATIMQDGCARETIDERTGYPKYQADVMAAVSKWLKNTQGGELIDPPPPPNIFAPGYQNPLEASLAPAPTGP